MDKWQGFRILEFIGGEEKVAYFPNNFASVGEPSSSNDGASPNRTHIGICGQGFRPEHIAIFRQGKELIVHNVANDPFCLINGEPFFKKRIDRSASLRIKHVELRIEDLENQSREAHPSLAETNHPQGATTSPSKREDVALTTWNAPVEPLEGEETFRVGKKTPSRPQEPPLLKSSEKKSTEKFPEKPSEKSTEKSPKESLLKLDLSSSRAYTFTFSFKNLLSFILAFIGIIGTLVTFEGYLRLYDLSRMAEFEAATLIADVSMALTNAQLHHITPEKHDWSDPEFIRKNLIALLDSPPHFRIEEGSLVSGSSYRIRIYTSQDLSRFLLIAHPIPSLLQWLIPKKSLAIDSSSMNIRRLDEVKTLNRLLAPMTTIDGLNGTIVSQQLERGEIIPLNTIAQFLGKHDFSPPPMVAYLRPGAENLIYNAPRYRTFGQAFLEKGFYFASLATSSHEMLMLQSELEDLKKLPSFILYSTGSIEKAKLALSTLKRISPQSDFVLAELYLGKNHQIRSIEIVLDSSPEISHEAAPQTPRILLSQAIPITPLFSKFPEHLLSKSNVAPIDETPQEAMALLEEVKIAIEDTKRTELEIAFQEYLRSPSEEPLQYFLSKLAHFSEVTSPKETVLLREVPFPHIQKPPPFGSATWMKNLLITSP